MLMVHDIDPDGLRVVINWDRFTVGTSFFVPCINTKKAREQLKKITNSKEFSTESRVCTENGLLGIRVWRTR